MRVLRVVALLLALPILAAGILGWWTMRHRSPDGTFHATITPIDVPGRVLVVPDLDAILSRDAPIVRADRTTLRLATPGFIGIAAPTDVAAYLAGAGYTAVEGLSLGRGPLPVRVRHITAASGEALGKPQDQDFWVRRGEGELAWTPAVDREHRLALVIVAPPGSEPVALTASVTAGWLDSTTWGLLIVGPMLMLLGLAPLAWPARPSSIHVPAQPCVLSATQSGRADEPPGLPWPPTESVKATEPPGLPWPPTESVKATEPPGLPWPPTESVKATEPPRDLPMPFAGGHPHLMESAQK